MRIFPRGVGVALLLSAAVALPAQACDFGYCWGAVATGPDGIVGYASRQPTAQAVDQKVRASCGDKCDVIEVFHDKCAAIAETYDRAVYSGFGDTRLDASDQALTACSDNGHVCSVRVWACSQK